MEAEAKHQIMSVPGPQTNALEIETNEMECLAAEGGIMALTIEREAAGADRMATLQLVDTDVHNDLPSLEELRPFLAQKWHPWLDSGGPGVASRYYANMGSGRMDDAVNEEDGLAAGDPDWVLQQLMTKYRIDIGVRTADT